MTGAAPILPEGITLRIGWLSQKAADIPGTDDWLSESERKRLAGLSSPKRCNDWRLGRWTAKRLVAAFLGASTSKTQLSELEIRPAADGAPELFLGGSAIPVSLSISHSSGVSLCAVGRFPLTVGCDIESVMPHDPVFVQDYFTTEEIELLHQAPEARRDSLITLIWGAKESALKVLREGLRRDTRSVVVSFDLQPRQQDWNLLTVRCVESARIFPGWWTFQGHQALCIVADRPTMQPREAPPSFNSLEIL
jgi:4'-phosphopantetheinyl transferase